MKRKSKNTFLAIVALVVIVIVGYFLLIPQGLDPERISAEVANNQAVLLDVRTDKELADDGLAVGSVHFDLARLQDEELPEIDKDTKIYTYCKGGTRAGKAKDILETNGFTNVENIGGLADWIDAGGEVVQ